MPYIMAIAAFIWLIISHSKSTKETILAKFIVTDAWINNEDFSAIYVSNKAFFQFYTIGRNTPITFGGVMDKEDIQSYGYVYNIDVQKLVQKEGNAKHEEHTFDWSFENSNDKSKGTATVALIKHYTATGVTFDLFIYMPHGARLTFKGYMEGSLKQISS
jgi:hypothetical protein